MRPEPAHLTLGPGLPAFATRLPCSVQTPKDDTHRLSTGRNSQGGEAMRRRWDTSPQATGGIAAILLCYAGCPEVLLGVGGAGSHHASGTELVGGAEALPATLAASARTQLWVRGFRVVVSLLGAESLRRGFPLNQWEGRLVVPFPKATTGGTSMEVFTAFSLGMMEGRP